MDIGSGKGYPATSLSNFAPHPFVFDGVECNSMEGLLQSFKFSSVDMQQAVCKLVGKAAKFKGKPKKWFTTQTLYWKGISYDRHSEDYQRLLDRAFDALSQNQSFQKALLATGDSSLTHEIGRSDASKTVLTKAEFISRLVRIRQRLQNTK